MGCAQVQTGHERLGFEVGADCKIGVRSVLLGWTVRLFCRIFIGGSVNQLQQPP